MTDRERFVSGEYVVFGETHCQITTKRSDGIQVLCTHGGWYAGVLFSVGGAFIGLLVEHPGGIRRLTEYTITDARTIYQFLGEPEPRRA